MVIDLGKSCIKCVLALPVTRTDGIKTIVCRYDRLNFKEIGTIEEMKKITKPTWCPIVPRVVRPRAPKNSSPLEIPLVRVPKTAKDSS